MTKLEPPDDVEPDAPEQPTARAINDEIAAMRRLVNALDGLPDDNTRRRVLTWLVDRYGHDTPKEAT